MRRIREIKEVTPEVLQNLRDEIYQTHAILTATSLALYRIDSEPDPISKAVTISFAVENAAQTLEEISGTIQDFIDRR